MIHHLAQDQFSEGAVGTLVTDPDHLIRIATEATSSFDFSSGMTPGQGFIVLPEEAKNIVLPGVVPRSLMTDNTAVIREHRGRKSVYVDRTKVDLGVCDMVAAIVYTKDAFFSDPEVTNEDKNSLKGTDHTHVLITTVGAKGDKSPITPNGFMRNVGGRNERWAMFFGTDIQKKAEEFVAQSADEPIDTPLEESAGWRFCEWVRDSGPGGWAYEGSPARINPDLQTLRAAVDPDNGPLASVVEKLISTTQALVETASSSMKYWKEWSLVA